MVEREDGWLVRIYANDSSLTALLDQAVAAKSLFYSLSSLTGADKINKYPKIDSMIKINLRI